MATLGAAAQAAPVVVELAPTDNVWVYPFAPDPTEDGFLRTWGRRDCAVDEPAMDNHEFSYSCLRFDLKGLPGGKPLTAAKLVLFHVPEVGYDLAKAAKYPAEIRPVTPAFNEKEWQFDMATQVLPPADPKAIFATAVPKPGEEKKPFAVEFDLLKGPAKFADYLAKARSSEPKALGLALTTRLEPNGSGDGSIMKFYSRHAQPKLRPKLVLTFE